LAAGLARADAWPEQEMGLVAVDVADGKPGVLRRESGATLAAAVAASCCLPGLSPPVSICGPRYMDGGMRSAANADLASGFDSILAVPSESAARAAHHDTSTPLDQTGRKTVALIPGSQLVVYEGAGHRLPITHMERLNHDLLLLSE
jgi:NTE family protein